MHLLNRSGFLGRLAHMTWYFFRNLVSEFMEKKCQKSAAALTYMTLFALVPMMTVTYSMFSLFPVFDGVGDKLQALIFDNFVPETGAEVKNYLTSFSSQARSLTAPGAAMLVLTAYLMLSNIEKTFNTIWGVSQSRRGLSSFLLYWAVLSIGPILLGAGLLMSTYLISLKLVVGDVDLLSAVAPIFRIVPILMASVAFTLLFLAVPNCRVPTKDAVIGGVVTATLFEMAKMAFGAFVANSSFQLIYGAFAAVPVFLLWVNFLWMIILAGAVFVRTLAEKEYVGGALRHHDFVAILLCLEIFHEKSQTGEAISDKDCVGVGIGLVHWQRLRAMLVADNWIVVTESGDYVLSRDVKSLFIWDVAKLVRLPVGTQLNIGDIEKKWLKKVEDLQIGVNSYTEDAMNMSIEALFLQKT